MRKGFLFVVVLAALHLTEFSFAERCEITKPAGCDCGQGCSPWYAPLTIFDDPTALAQNDKNVCLGQAAVYQSYCNVYPSNEVTATYFDPLPLSIPNPPDWQGASESFNRCEISKPTHCPAQNITHPAVIVDWYHPSPQDPNRCYQRAEEYYNWCGMGPLDHVTARSYVNGKYQGEFRYENRCEITKPSSCPNHPNTDYANKAVFNDVFSSNSVWSANDTPMCMQRASAYHSYCGFSPEQEVIARSVIDGLVVAEQSSGTPQTVAVGSYGAFPNDSVDDTVAIQNAINAVAQNGGGEILFPLGEFLVSSPITISTSGVRLRGSQDASGNYTQLTLEGSGWNGAAIQVWGNTSSSSIATGSINASFPALDIGTQHWWLFQLYDNNYRHWFPYETIENHTLNVANGSLFSAGDFVEIYGPQKIDDSNNPPTLVCDDDNEQPDECHFYQNMRILAVNGNELTFSGSVKIPINVSTDLQPTVTKINPIRNVSIIGFYIDGTDANGSLVEGINLQRTSDIVLRNLTFEGVRDNAVHTFTGLGNTFTEIKMHSSSSSGQQGRLYLQRETRAYVADILSEDSTGFGPLFVQVVDSKIERIQTFNTANRGIKLQENMWNWFADVVSIDSAKTGLSIQDGSSSNLFEHVTVMETGHPPNEMDLPKLNRHKGIVLHSQGVQANLFKYAMTLNNKRWDIATGAHDSNNEFLLLRPLDPLKTQDLGNSLIELFSP